jgi:hypothetical protein
MISKIKVIIEKIMTIVITVVRGTVLIKGTPLVTVVLLETVAIELLFMSNFNFTQLILLLQFDGKIIVA